MRDDFLKGVKWGGLISLVLWSILFLVFAVGVHCSNA